MRGDPTGFALADEGAGRGVPGVPIGLHAGGHPSGGALIELPGVRPPAGRRLGVGRLPLLTAAQPRRHRGILPEWHA